MISMAIEFTSTRTLIGSKGATRDRHHGYTDFIYHITLVDIARGFLVTNMGLSDGLA